MGNHRGADVQLLNRILSYTTPAIQAERGPKGAAAKPTLAPPPSPRSSFSSAVPVADCLEAPGGSPQRTKNPTNYDVLVRPFLRNTKSTILGHVIGSEFKHKQKIQLLAPYLPLVRA